jgi:single-strand DNA-binding protein
MGLSVNKVELIGNLGRDPEMRTTQAGKTIATFSIATSESWKDQRSGEWVDKTEWHRVVIFDERLARIAEAHLSQGMKVRVEGKLRTRKWQDQSGADRYSTEVHLENYSGDLRFDMKKPGERAGDGATRDPSSQGPGGGLPDDDEPPY